MSYSAGCPDAKPAYLSPVAKFANRLLTGDWEKGEFGLLVRTVDYFFDGDVDSIREAILKHNNIPPDPIPPVRYLPSSYLHASIRAPGAIYQNVHEMDANRGDFALLFGTKFAKNTIFQEHAAFQNNNQTLDCEHIYMHDAGTVDRGTVFDKTMCNDASAEADICMDGDGDEKRCLAHGPGGCGGCKAAPEDVGPLVAEWVEARDEKMRSFYSASCYYDDIKNVVIGSNSLWRERFRWHDEAELSHTYQGYTECATNLDIAHPHMADAVILTLHRTDNPLPQTICNFPNHEFLLDRLQQAYDKGHGDLPVLFYRESPGIHSVDECARLFGGKACDDAWHKEFFSQEYHFVSSGACLHRPPGCDEVYFFPADNDDDNTNNECSAYTDKGKSRIDRLCGGREQRQDARVAYDTILKKSKRTPVVVKATTISEETPAPINVPEPTSEPVNTTVASFLVDSRETNLRASIVGGAASTTTVEVGTSLTTINAMFFLVGMILSVFLQRRGKISIGYERKTTRR